MDGLSPKRSIAGRAGRPRSLHSGCNEIVPHEKERLQELLVQGASLAHDLCGLLTVMDLCASLALTELQSDHPVSADLRELRKAGHRANSLARKIVDLGRADASRIVVSDLISIVVDLEPILRRLVGDGIELSICSTLADAPVLGNASDFAGVILNLTTNARDAMPEGGRISIHVGHSSRPDHVCLTVRDNGRGMDEITMKHLFEPYFTSKAPGRGTGLGLVSVRHVVQGYGGAVAISSSPDGGTSVEVLLPRAVAE